MQDALSIVEAAYREAPDEATWLEHLIDAGDFLDRGLGVSALGYHVGSLGVTISNIVGAEGAVPDAFRERRKQDLAMEVFEREHGREILMRIWPRTPTVGSVTQLSGMSAERTGEFFTWIDPAWGRGKQDIFGIIAGDPSGYGTVLCSTSSVTVKAAPRDVRLLTHVAVHIAHGHRLLRARLRSGVQSAVDAVLGPDGRVHHLESEHVASSDAEALSFATQQVDRARSKLRRAAPDEALALWRGLVDGRWTLVDHIDQDGRRYVLARRNAPVAHAWASLTERQKQVIVYAAHGHSRKLIAYELGLPASTVRYHLGAAARRLGLPSTAALLAAYRRDHPESEETPGRVESGPGISAGE